jgi:hypothetical protein
MSLFEQWSEAANRITEPETPPSRRERPEPHQWHFFVERALPEGCIKVVSVGKRGARASFKDPRLRRSSRGPGGIGPPAPRPHRARGPPMTRDRMPARIKGEGLSTPEEKRGTRPTTSGDSPTRGRLIPPQMRSRECTSGPLLQRGPRLPPACVAQRIMFDVGVGVPLLLG